jgi:hypothetical protein
MGLFKSGAEVDPKFSTAKTDGQRRLAFRADEIRNMIEALDREADFARVAIGFAEQARLDAAAAVKQYERDGRPGRAAAALLEQGRAEARIDMKQAQLKMIADERKRWAAKRPDRDSDW